MLTAERLKQQAVIHDLQRNLVPGEGGGQMSEQASDGWSECGGPLPQRSMTVPSYAAPDRCADAACGPRGPRGRGCGIATGVRGCGDSRGKGRSATQGRASGVRLLRCHGRAAPQANAVRLSQTCGPRPTLSRPLFPSPFPSAVQGPNRPASQSPRPLEPLHLALRPRLPLPTGLPSRSPFDPTARTEHHSPPPAPPRPELRPRPLPGRRRR